MTRPSSQPMNRSELYRWVMALGFCAYDMLLYLDTHPDDAQALSYYNPVSYTHLTLPTKLEV